MIVRKVEGPGLSTAGILASVSASDLHDAVFEKCLIMKRM